MRGPEENIPSVPHPGLNAQAIAKAHPVISPDGIFLLFKSDHLGELNAFVATCLLPGFPQSRVPPFPLAFPFTSSAFVCPITRPSSATSA